MPPKNKKKDVKRKELTEEDMRRMGMTDDDIARIMAERNKSSDDKKADKEREEAQRKENEQRQRAQREIQQQLDELVREEGHPRVDIVTEEESAWAQLEPELTVEKTRLLRAHAEQVSLRRKEEAKQRREAELQAYQATLHSMSEAERAAFISAQIAKEEERTSELVAAEEARRAKEERRAARRAARAARMQNATEEDFLDSSDEETDKRTKLSAKAKIDDLDFAMRERFLGE